MFATHSHPENEGNCVHCDFLTSFENRVHLLDDLSDAQLADLLRRLVASDGCGHVWWSLYPLVKRMRVSATFSSKSSVSGSEDSSVAFSSHSHSRKKSKERKKKSKKKKRSEPKTDASATLASETVTAATVTATSKAKTEDLAKGKGKKRKRSAFTGVFSEDDGKHWIATIQHQSKRRRLGLFGTEKEAAVAYDTAARALRGVSARTNFKAGETPPIAEDCGQLPLVIEPNADAAVAEEKSGRDSADSSDDVNLFEDFMSKSNT